MEVTAANSAATAESTSATRPRAAGCLLARYGMASPECTAFNSTLSIEREKGGRRADGADARTWTDDHDIGEYK